MVLQEEKLGSINLLFNGRRKAVSYPKREKSQFYSNFKKTQKVHLQKPKKIGDAQTPQDTPNKKYMDTMVWKSSFPPRLTMCFIMLSQGYSPNTPHPTQIPSNSISIPPCFQFVGYATRFNWIQAGNPEATRRIYGYEKKPKAAIYSATKS